MSHPHSELRPHVVDAAKILTEAGADFALVGGLAFGLRGEMRFTHDVDFVVAVPDDAAAESIINRFVQRGYQPDLLLEQTSAHRLCTIRLLSPKKNPEAQARTLVDLIFATTGIEREIVDSASPTRAFEDLGLKVADTPHLIAMKTLAASDRRMRDYSDLSVLIRDASDAELDLARKLVRLIQERGYHNDQDLPAKLEGFIVKWQGMDPDDWGGNFVKRPLPPQT